MNDGHPEDAQDRSLVGAVPEVLPPGRRRRSQEERRDASKKGLLTAALELIGERGFRATSFQAIAQRAGYSPSLVSHRFGSKEGLLSEMVRRMLSRWGTDVREVAIESRTGADALKAIAAAHRTALEQSPSAVRAMYMLLFESLIDAQELRREFVALDQRLRADNAALLRAAQPPDQTHDDVDAEAQAALFLAMLRGITLQWLVDPQALDLPRVYAALDHMLERGLRR